ncbi:hypothetical protein FA13DRAFT_1797515 [Coprinellus micaceus]|uniref:Uncharacterized protein n=1 Tax=Coprinellus micaceus TaxID=71717 RepID=A0A4Y7SR10_COPMI|nr:hypothetical protein FA13DRAFT_1797515 [Coprinellus micaceus]
MECCSLPLQSPWCSAIDMDIFAKMRRDQMGTDVVPKPEHKHPANIWATMGANVRVHTPAYSQPSTERPRLGPASSSSHPSTVLALSSTHPSTVTDPGSEDEDMLDGEEGVDNGQEELEGDEEEEEDDTRSYTLDEVADGNFHQSRQSPTFNQGTPLRLSDQWDQAFVQNNPEEARMVSIEIFNFHIIHLRWTYSHVSAWALPSPAPTVPLHGSSSIPDTNHPSPTQLPRPQHRSPPPAQLRCPQHRPPLSEGAPLSPTLTTPLRRSSSIPNTNPPVRGSSSVPTPIPLLQGSSLIPSTNNPPPTQLLRPQHQIPLSEGAPLSRASTTPRRHSLIPDIDHPPPTLLPRPLHQPHLDTAPLSPT